mgnify:CR=1 FL=1
MANLKLKVKKTKLKRKINGVSTLGYYGRVISNGKKSYEQVALESCVNTTVHKAEMKVAAELFLDGIAANLKNGYIVDLGPLGTLYPSVESNWHTDPDDCTLDEQKPKVSYRPSADIKSAISAAQVGWTEEKETEDNTVDDDTPSNPGGGNGDDTELG